MAATGKPKAQPAAGARRAPRRTRKNVRLDQRLLDDARRVLGVESETEAITVALQRLVGNERIMAGLRALGGTRLVDPRLVAGDLDAG